MRAFPNFHVSVVVAKANNIDDLLFLCCCANGHG